MPYIKLLTALTALALLTACGGGTAETPDTAGGNATDCKTNAFHADCNADAPAIKLRQDMCLEDDSADSTCGVVITGACEANPFRTETACGHTDYDDDRETACLADTTKHSTCVGDTGIATVFCEADPFNTATACVHDDYDDERQTACLADTTKHPSCVGEMGIATVFCEANPFDTATPCMHGDYNDDRETTCQTHGTDETDGHATCATILIPLCVIADPFAHAGCDDVVGINAGVRTMFCQMPANAWNPKCMDTTHGAVNATRVTACQMFGTGMGGDDSCATSLASACTITNPFAHAGCDDVANINADIRTPYCQTPANAWNPKCMDTTHGTVTATRVTACQMFGTGMGGDDSCATSLASMCLIANPFIHEGCNDVVGIDAGLRTTYCAMPINAFKTGCKTDGTHGDVLAARGKACVEFGIDTMTGGHGSCIGNTLAESSCAMNPFDLAKPGCAILTKFPMIVETYCGSNPSIDDCGVKTSTWVENARNADNTAGLAVRGIRDARANDTQYTLITGGAESLELGDAVTKDATNFGDLTFKNTEVPANGTFRGETAFIGNPNVAGGISYATNVGATKLYAGLLSDTKVGAPLAAAPTANWLGRLGIINGENIITTAFHAVVDFQLVIDFTNTTLSQTVALSNRETTFYEQFVIAGKFNDKGVIFGTATYELRRTSDNALNSSGTGILTGLIGQKGAAAVFHRTSGVIDFVGGFVAAPPPPPPSVATHANFKTYYAASARVVTERLHPTPTTTNATTAFLEGTATGLDTTGLTFPNNNTFMPVAVRLKEEETGDDGFALVYGTAIAGGNLRFRAGLLSGTDLGPAVATTGMATWAGSLHWANSVSRLVRVALPTVTVDFANGTIKTDAVTVRSNRTIAIDGLFGSAHSLPDGILGGDAIYTDGVPTRLPLIGLIGTEGAIGVFIGTIATVIGGFQASPSE